ncbi:MULTISPECIES: hypothetical protein [unclassified Streptomyces]|uniref:hypothetical protein n=1 Tax=unclassified Streptomyces TaxID=2593676 RepID=UPI001FD4ACF7|nr:MULTISPECIES: hypothetical protein [unclassified Streptomyces]MCZ4101520.1 hypothetical protein [Streptomyces sp. H39-C1]
MTAELPSTNNNLLSTRLSGDPIVTRTTLPMTTALTLATALVLTLTACGGDTKASDKATAAPSTAARTTASASVSPTPSAVQRPVITLPSDVKDVFEGARTGDPKKDAVLADNAEAIRGVDAAIVAGKPSAPAVGFYYEGEAAAAESEWIKRFADHGLSITGTVRYYDRKVTFRSDGNASLVYCGDESKGFNKDRATGKADVTPVTKNSYVVYNTLLKKNKQGIWQTIKVLSQRGAAQCQP